MPRRRLRAALAAAVAAPLLIGPVGADAASGPLTCPAASKAGLFQRLPIEEFRGVPSVQTRDVVTGYALDERRPERVLATNGNTVKVSTSHGCAWDDGLVLEASASGGIPSGLTSTIVALAHLPNGPALAAVREGTGAASRPLVVRSGSGARGTWSASTSGLPVQGSPRLLEAASDGRTAYLSLSPTTDAGGGNGGTLPTVPGVGSPTGGPAGLLYATTDGGASWELRTAAGALGSGASGFDALAVDAGDPNVLYGVSGGRFVVSRDGGQTLEIDPQLSGVTAVEPMDPGEVSILVGSGQLLWSRDAGKTYVGRPAPAGATSAAHRTGSSFVVVEAGGRLHAVEARGRGTVRSLDASVATTAGSARGDRAADGSFHALAGHSLLRYVDPSPPKTPPPPVVGDAVPPPPKPGAFSPGRTAVRLPVGSSRVVPLELRLPRNPTPTDVYLLLDISPSMDDELRQLRTDFNAFVGGVQDGGIALRVGLATIGIGPREGEAPYPEFEPRAPDKPPYRKPRIYEQLRALGPLDAQLSAALGRLTLQTCPSNRCDEPQEGHLLALEEMLDGNGIMAEQSSSIAPVYAVPPGQAAGFRNVQGVRKVAVMASDDEFNAPYPTPTGADGRPTSEYVDKVAAQLRARGVSFVGLAATTVGGGSKAAADMKRFAELVGTTAPAGGVDCGQDIFIPAGAPLVCDGGSDVTTVLTRLVKSLADRQSVSLTGRGATEVLGFLDGRGLKNLDVTSPNTVSVPVRVSCVDVAAGTRTAQVDASLRGFRVATATLDVTCTPVAVAAVVPPRPEAAPPQEAPPAQPAQPPPAPAPAPPVVQTQVQAQVQGQVQAQVQPLTAAALQQQEELQLALALLADEKPSPSNELAMVDRRRSEELRALALLALSMSGASALGVARLRSRRAEQVRVVRSR